MLAALASPEIFVRFEGAGRQKDLATAQRDNNMRVPKIVHESGENSTHVATTRMNINFRLIQIIGMTKLLSCDQGVLQLSDIETYEEPICCYARSSTKGRRISITLPANS